MGISTVTSEQFSLLQGIQDWRCDLAGVVFTALLTNKNGDF